MSAPLLDGTRVPIEHTLYAFVADTVYNILERYVRGKWSVGCTKRIDNQHILRTGRERVHQNWRMSISLHVQDK